MKNKKNVGWQGESRRHSLARKGIRTAKTMRSHGRGNWKIPYSEENFVELFLQLGEKSKLGWALIQDCIQDHLYHKYGADEYDKLMEELGGEIEWEGSIDYVYDMSEDEQKQYYDLLMGYYRSAYGEWENKQEIPYKFRKQLDELVDMYDELTTSDLQGIIGGIVMKEPNALYYGLNEDDMLDYVYEQVEKKQNNNFKASGKPFIDFHKVNDTPATLMINNKRFELHNGFRNKRKAEVEISSVERTGEYVAEIVESNDPFYPFKVYKRKVN